jgi:pimeloyl-ACP methyl ester carboxylesterase
LGEVFDLLMEASAMRPAFTSTGEIQSPPRPVRLATGVGAIELVCIPSFITGSGPHQFQRIARAIDRTYPVSVVLPPGFNSGDALPASWDVAIESLVNSIIDTVTIRPVTLVGYSIGGVIAHAAVKRLEDRGCRVTGLVLLDTYQVDDDHAARALSAALDQVLQWNVEGLLDDEQVLAMGAYARLLRGWVPSPVVTPSLLVKASTPLVEHDRIAHWKLADKEVELPSTHFGMIREDAQLTADVVTSWLSTIASTGLRPHSKRQPTARSGSETETDFTGGTGERRQH